MKLQLLPWMAAAIACLGVLLPHALAAPPTVPPGAAAAPKICPQDVALRPGGLLIGRVVDGQGIGRPGVAVSVMHGTHEVVRTTTDANGVFAAQGIRGGQYLILSPEGQLVCRAWAEGTAPPSASAAAVLAPGDDLARGQFGYGLGIGKAWLEWMRAHPYLTAGTVAAAIAVPLAFADDDWQPGS